MPANAAQRLGGRSAVILSLRDVLGGLAGTGAIVLTVLCEVPEQVAPVLRAARDLDAVIGIAPTWGAKDPRGRHGFFETVAEAAEEIGHRRALVLVAPPVRLASLDDVESAESQVHTWVDAGYTHVPLDLTGLPPEDAPGAVSRAAGALIERELGLELLLEPGHEDAAGELAASLKLLRAPLDLIGVRGGEAVGLSGLAGEIEPLGASWHEGEDDAELRGGLRNAVDAGVRLVALRSPFTRRAVSGLPRDLPERLLDEARSGGGLEAAARRFAGELAALGPESLDRTEAAVYAEAVDLLGLLRLGGSHRRLTGILARD